MWQTRTIEVFLSWRFANGFLDEKKKLGELLKEFAPEFHWSTFLSFLCFFFRWRAHFGHWGSENGHRILCSGQTNNAFMLHLTAPSGNMLILSYKVLNPLGGNDKCIYSLRLHVRKRVQTNFPKKGVFSSFSDLGERKRGGQ